jgi:hypothetical protein
MKRLDFMLPEFTRLSWVSDVAREVWEPRLERIAKAWLVIEWLSVVAGLRSCCVTMVSPEEFAARSGEWLKRGLTVLALEIQTLSNYVDADAGEKTTPGMPFVFRIVLGTHQSVLDCQNALEAGDNREIAKLLGIPPCCYAFLEKVSTEDGLEDTTWPMAIASVVGMAEANRHVDLTGPPEANILWRWMGARAVPHLPCSFICEHTVKLGKEFIQIGRRFGFEEEMDWLLEILSWPVHWSALHGIAEIKTPVLKVSTRTDATPWKYTVQRQGQSYPSDAVQGLNFPYQTCDSRSICNNSRVA